MEVIVKKDISHYNRALNKQINTKRQYNDEMKRQGMVSFEQGKDMARQAVEKNTKPYKTSEETMRFLTNVKGKSRNGEVKLSGREIAYIESKGIKFKRPEEKPLKGGWG